MSDPAKSERYHALDSLRASMMLLGVLLHGALPYSTLSLGRFEDANTAGALDVLLVFIHIFRMPVFFMMAGFFGALLLARRGNAGMLANRARLVLVPLIASWILLTPLIRAGIKFARAAKEFDSVAAGFDALTLRTLITPNDIHHLWFLGDLMLFYLLMLGILRLSGRLDRSLRERLSASFRSFLQSRWRALALALPTALALLPAPLAPVGELSAWEALAMQLAPLLFFCFGWMLHGHVELLASFQRRAWLQIALALALYPISFLASREASIAGDAWNSLPHLLAAAVNSLIVCLLVFGITGLFLRYSDRALPAMRYLSDASYWIYLVHFPLVLWIAGLLAPTELDAFLKLGILLCTAAALLLLSYHFLVRSTFVGFFLNGKRIQSRRKPRPARPVLGRDSEGFEPSPVK